jgi:hypothetical protein
MANVNPGGIVLYARLGSGYYPIACSKDVSITTESGSIETAPKTNGVWRTYEYERMTGSITGSGLVQVVSDAGKYNVLDIWSYQFSQLPVLCKFQMTDVDANVSVYECEALVESVTIGGSASAPGSSFNYTLKINGAFSASTTPTAGGTTVDSWVYTEAVGGTTIIGDAVLIGADVLSVARSGDDMPVITSGTPTGNQVKFTSGTGQLEFAYALGIDEWITVVYVS